MSDKEQNKALKILETQLKELEALTVEYENMLTPPTKEQLREFEKIAKKYEKAKLEVWESARKNNNTLEDVNNAITLYNDEFLYITREKELAFDIANINALCERGIKEPSFLSYMDKAELTRDTNEEILKLHYVCVFCLPELVRTEILKALKRFLKESERRKEAGQPVEVKEALFQRYKDNIYKTFDNRIFSVITVSFEPLFNIFKNHKLFIENAIKQELRRNSDFVDAVAFDVKSFNVEDLPKEILNISPSKDLFTIGDITGQYKLYAGYKRSVYFAIYTADKNTPEELRRLTPYDRRIYNAVATLYDKTKVFFEDEYSKFKIITFDNLYYLLTGKKLNKSAPYQIENIIESLNRLRANFIDINTQKEFNERKKDGAKSRNSIDYKNKPLLMADIIGATIEGRPARVLAIKDEPVLLDFMKTRGELVNIPVEALATPNQLTDNNILVEDYLLDYIYRYTNTKLPQIDVFLRENHITRNKMRIVETFEKTLNYYRKIGIIKTFEIKDGEIKKMILSDKTKKLSLEGKLD